MKTKEFIEMLQGADPSGEAHIRLGDGVPYAAELKFGYWDGPYKYMENDKFIVSTEDFKVDIHCMDIDDFVDENYGGFSPNHKTWDEIKDLFEFKFTYAIKSQKQERIDRYLKIAKEAYDNTHNIYEKQRIGMLNKSVINYDKGWTYFQNKLVDSPDSKKFNDHYYYTWLVYDENGKDQGSNIHNVGQIMHSGLFQKIDNNVKDGYYQWLKK